jgi:hypothetical protein
MKQKQLDDLRVCLMNIAFNIKEDLEFSDDWHLFFTEKGLEKVLATLRENEKDFKPKITKTETNLPLKPVEPDEYFQGIMHRED